MERHARDETCEKGLDREKHNTYFGTESPAALPATPGLKLTGVLSRLGGCAVGSGLRGIGFRF